jgi:hypothetical protein
MENDKSMLYIIAIVAIVALVALVMLAMFRPIATPVRLTESVISSEGTVQDSIGQAAAARSCRVQSDCQPNYCCNWNECTACKIV